MPDAMNAKLIKNREGEDLVSWRILTDEHKRQLLLQITMIWHSSTVRLPLNSREARHLSESLIYDPHQGHAASQVRPSWQWVFIGLSSSATLHVRQGYSYVDLTLPPDQFLPIASALHSEAQRIDLITEEAIAALPIWKKLFAGTVPV